MSHTVHDHLASGNARLVEQPSVVRNHVEVDRNFGLPSAFYSATVACYLGFLAITWAAFANPELAIPMVIFAVFIVAGFGVPMVWTRLKGNTTQPQTMGEFQMRGIMTHTGPLAPRDATIQMLILPVLLVVWGLAVAVIAALVT